MSEAKINERKIEIVANRKTFQHKEPQYLALHSAVSCPVKQILKTPLLEIITVFV